jgi:hypothetical protein
MGIGTDHQEWMHEQGMVWFKDDADMIALKKRAKVKARLAMEKYRTRKRELTMKRKEENDTNKQISQKPIN